MSESSERACRVSALFEEARARRDQCRHRLAIIRASECAEKAERLALTSLAALNTRGENTTLADLERHYAVCDAADDTAKAAESAASCATLCAAESFAKDAEGYYQACVEASHP